MAQHSATSETRALHATKVFDNLVTVDGLLPLLEKWLKKQYRRSTVYKWVGQGMPAKKFRGDLYFDPNEVALWLQRSS